MAFTGTPVVTLVADNLVRIHVSPVAESTFALLPGDSGTIGLFPKATPAEVTLPEAFKPGTYQNVSLQDSIQCDVTFVETALAIQPVRVVKTGTTPEDFAITLTNDSDSVTGDTGDLEIYVRFH